VRDVGLLVALAAVASVALRRPWLGVIGLAFVGYMQPHSYAGGFMGHFPVYRALFAATVLGALLSREWRLPPRDWRVAVLLLFWLGLLISTWRSAFPFLAWPRLVEVSGVLGSAVLILLLIDTRKKLLVLMAAMAGSFALVSLKGGYWAIIYGFSDRVYGPPGSQYYDNNHFAVAAVMAIPLLVLWLRQTADRGLRVALGAGIALSILAALSSWSRGALLALGVTLVLLLTESRKKALALIPIALAAAVALAFLPEQWFERMETIASWQTEGSARGRLDAWRRGIEFTLGRPLLGAGFEGWLFGAKSPDWHSAYIEIMAEQGLVNFLFWMSLILGTLFSLTRLAWRYRGSADQAWVVDYSRALRASLIAYCVGGAFLGIAYWDLLYHLIAAAIVLGVAAAGRPVRALQPGAAGS
jgi:probable O-glycosylation ligase (exosortase A-associated)